MALFHRAFELAAKTFSGKGTCLEFGVGWGSTYSWQINKIIKEYPELKLYGFDSWQGLPEETKGIWCPERHGKGCLSYPKQTVQDFIPKGDSRFALIDGFFIDSLTADLQAKLNKVVFVNIDVDIHSSTIQVLNFIEPLLQPGTILYWDDWKDPNDENAEPWGEHLAWEQWSLAKPSLVVELLEVNTVNQRSMLVVETKVGKLSTSRKAEIRRSGIF